MRADRTSQISDPGAAEHADEFAGRAAVVADGDHVAERAFPLLHDVVEDVHEAVGGGSAGEHDNSMGSSGSGHGEYGLAFSHQCFERE